MARRLRVIGVFGNSFWAQRLVANSEIRQERPHRLKQLYVEQELAVKEWPVRRWLAEKGQCRDLRKDW